MEGRLRPASVLEDETEVFEGDCGRFERAEVGRLEEEPARPSGAELFAPVVVEVGRGLEAGGLKALLRG